MFNEIFSIKLNFYLLFFVSSVNSLIISIICYGNLSFFMNLSFGFDIFQQPKNSFNF